MLCTPDLKKHCPALVFRCSGEVPEDREIPRRSAPRGSAPVRFCRAVPCAHIVSALLVFLLFAFPAGAQMSLQEAVLIAAAKDPDVEALRQEVAARTIDIEAARDAYFPSINLSGDTGTTDSDGPGVTLSVTQVLFDWGLTRSQITEASQVRVQAVSDLKMAIEALSFEIAGFFIDAEVMKRKIAYTNDYLAFAQRLARQAQARATAGVSDIGEVARARLEIARAEDQLSQLMANRQIAMAQLEFLIGQPVPAINEPPAIGFAAHYESPEKIAAAVRVSPEYIAARAEVAEAEAGLEAAKAKRYPTINLRAQGRVDLNGGDTQAAVGISTGMDLNSRGFGQRQVQSARLSLEGKMAALQGVDRQLKNTAASALQRIALLRRSEESRAIQLVESRKVLDAYEDQFVAGQREFLDLLTTGRDLYDAQIDEIDTYDERKRTEYESAKELGALGTLLQVPPVRSGNAELRSGMLK